MSNAGKSVLAAGLCRIFRQDGTLWLPFKSPEYGAEQFHHPGGTGDGRAQVMQAEAAGVEPSVRMNPVLLKPTSDGGSQVIVNGEVVGSMSAAAYLSYKKQLIPLFWSPTTPWPRPTISSYWRGRQPRRDQPEGGGHREYGDGPDGGGRLCCWRVTSTGAVSLLPFTGPWPCWSLMSGLW